MLTWSETTQQKSLFGCLGFFFAFSSFGGVFFLTAWYKKKKRKTSEIVISIILVKLCGCVCVRVCESEVQARGASGEGSWGHSGQGWWAWQDAGVLGCWSPHWEQLLACGTWERDLIPLLLLPA